MSTRRPRASTSNVHWRLEAFDLRAGLAFATLRGQQTPKQEVEDWPCLFFSPPSFTPEPVDNVASALAATRGCFTSGLFVEEAEAFFETPEDVAEFLRRAYVSSAGGDGADGGGEEGEPVPPTEPPDMPSLERPTPEEVSAALQKLAPEVVRDATYNFELRAAQTPLGGAFTSTWTSVEKTGIINSLAFGALSSVRELLRRYPAGRGPTGVRWLNDARALGSCISAMGLWPLLLSHPYRGQFAHLLNSLPGLTPEVPEGNQDLWARAFLLFVGGSLLDDANATEAIRYFHHFPSFIAFPGSHKQAIDDPLDLLRRLPLPDFAQPLVAADLKHRASLYHLLSTFIATPQAISRSSDVMATIDLTLFAATCIVTSRRAWADYAIYSELLFESPHVTDMQVHAIQMGGDEALQWLAEHLPARGFAASLEARIWYAKDIRYRTVAT